MHRHLCQHRRHADSGDERVGMGNKRLQQERTADESESGNDGEEKRPAADYGTHCSHTWLNTAAQQKKNKTMPRTITAISGTMESIDHSLSLY